MPTVRARDGAEIHYAVDDHTDPWRETAVLVLQHGYGRSAGFWYSWVPRLSRHYRVVRPDLRGLGRSPATFDLERLSVETYVADLLAVLDAAGAERVHYCGESLGGILGVALAAAHPERVRTLSLVASPVFINEATKRTFAFGHATWQDALRALGAEGWARAANEGFRFPPGTDRGLVAWYAREMGRSSVDVLIAMSRLASAVDVRPLLSKIQAPVLALYPSGGLTASDEQERALREGVHDIRVVRLPTPYHTIMTIAPDVCAAHVLHFAALHDGVALSG